MKDMEREKTHTDRQTHTQREMERDRERVKEAVREECIEEWKQHTHVIDTDTPQRPPRCTQDTDSYLDSHTQHTDRQTHLK